MYARSYRDDDWRADSHEKREENEDKVEERKGK